MSVNNKKRKFSDLDSDEDFEIDEEIDSDEEFDFGDFEIDEETKSDEIENLLESDQDSFIDDSEQSQDKSLESMLKSAISKALSGKINVENFSDCQDKKELELELEFLRLKIDKDSIKLEDILRENFLEKDKIELIRLFDILNNLSPNTIDYFEHEKFLKNKIKKLKAIPVAELSLIDEEQQRLKTTQPPSDFELKRKIYLLDADDKVKAKLYDMYNDLENLNRDNSEYNTLKAKIMWAISLPHRKLAFSKTLNRDSDINEVNNYCSDIYNKLNTHLHGMENVKERLMQTVLNRVYNPNTKSMLGLSSPPGRGKTAVASALAKAMDLPFERISLGGMEDPSIFKGTDNSWVGASPSIILHILRKMKVANGIVLFDEIDKLGNSARGREIQYALLHITDYVQNKEFHDLFLSEFTHDLSNIWFMFAMNNHEWLDPALKDRLDIVKVEKYSKRDVNEIIKKHFLPDAIINSGLKEGDITISKCGCNAIQSVLSDNIETDGLRPIQKNITSIVSKLNLLRVMSKNKDIKLSYKLPGFNNFPYEITKTSIDSLIERKYRNPSYIKMYM